jgi:hypothetical protein
MMGVLATAQVAIIDGIGFDPFFRGLLSVLVGVVVLCGGTYLLIATNTGARSGMMIACAGLFGWNLLMGIIWTVYGIGWTGGDPSWHLIEINVDDVDQNDDGLLFSEVAGAPDLHNIDIGVDVEDPDEAQVLALAKSETVQMGDWRYLTTADSIRGEAQAAADAYLVEEGVFEAGNYLPLQFGGFTRGGKPILEIEEDAGLISSQATRVAHFFNETFLNPTHSQELIVIQAQQIIAKPTLPGEPPPTAEVDPAAPLVSVIMDRDRGGPFPSIISGKRFTPFMFTIANGLLFAVFAWALHNRDRRMDLIRAAVS